MVEVRRKFYENTEKGEINSNHRHLKKFHGGCDTWDRLWSTGSIVVGREWKRVFQGKKTVWTIIIIIILLVVAIKIAVANIYWLYAMCQALFQVF